MTEKICQNNIQKKFKEQEMVLNQVCVKMMQINWLQQEAHHFLDLVEILSDMNDVTLFSTTFVSILLAGFWERYKQKIYYTQFLTFMIYMAAMM